MKTANQRISFNKKILVLSLLLAFGPAHAADKEDAEAEAEFSKPQSSVSAGLGALGGDNQDRSIFGQYNGLRKNSANFLLDFDINRRDEETGTWTTLSGRNLGLDSRSLGGTYQKQGDWRVSAEYSELVRRDPRTVNTGVQGAGSATPVVTALMAPGSGSDLNLKIKRTSGTVAAEKWLTPNLLFEASIKSEDKDGARLFGKGIACGAFSHAYNVCGAANGTGALLASTSAATLMLPEPINSQIRQIESRLSFSGEKLKLNGGYYGSFFSNSNGSLNPAVSGNLWNPNGSLINTGAAPGSSLLTLLNQPIALAPDNQAHQFFIDGTYSIAPTTRATFKYAYTHATQDADFAGMGLTGGPSGVASLGGVVNSSLAQLGITARPMQKLSLLANVRYEDKEDNTPIASYIMAGGKPYTNFQSSSNKLFGKVEANYQFSAHYRATLGVDYQEVHRDRPVGTALIDGLSGLREDTRELSYRAELRRSMSDTINMGLSYVHSERDGSSWLTLATGAGFPAVSDAAIYNQFGAFPVTLEDRKRNKVKVSVDWNPLEQLSLQLLYEDGKDTYTGPTEKGMRDTGMSFYGIDAAWQLSDKWKFTGYWNQGKQTFHVNQVTGYLAELAGDTDSVAFGVVANPMSKLELGANLSYTNDRNRYLLSMNSGAPVAGGGLPDVEYRSTTLNLFGKYALDKNAEIRVNLLHRRTKLDEWTWASDGTRFAYSDNTSVWLQPNQNTTFLGVVYIYKLK